jgi:uncharacterized phage protein (TIGR01671 family)
MTQEKREIKFRAYSKEQNKVFTVVKINWVSFAVWFKETDFIGNLGEHDTILLEYTGLNDKNGKEIYEGDIVALKGSTGIVKYGKHHPSFFIERNCYLEKYWDGLEVIGNIYENPELLNKEE